MASDGNQGVGERLVLYEPPRLRLHQRPTKHLLCTLRLSNTELHETKLHDRLNEPKRRTDPLRRGDRLFELGTRPLEVSQSRMVLRDVAHRHRVPHTIVIAQ